MKFTVEISGQFKSISEVEAATEEEAEEKALSTLHCISDGHDVDFEQSDVEVY